MDRTIVALFEDVNHAQAAVEELLAKGVSSQDVSVVRSTEASGWRTDLTELGVPEKDVALYSDGIQNGGTLLSVRTSKGEYADLLAIVNRFSPVEAGARLTQIQNPGSTSIHANQDPHTSVYARQFEDLESDFRKDWEARYSSKGGDYERYRPAYQYGWSAYGLFGSRAWEDLEPELEADWLHRHPSDAWEDFRDAARTGWESCKSGSAATGPGRV